jgi:hypothetical protein
VVFGSLPWNVLSTSQIHFFPSTVIFFTVRAAPVLPMEYQL